MRVDGKQRGRKLSRRLMRTVTEFVSTAVVPVVASLPFQCNILKMGLLVLLTSVPRGLAPPVSSFLSYLNPDRKIDNPSQSSISHFFVVEQQIKICRGRMCHGG